MRFQHCLLVFHSRTILIISLAKAVLEHKNAAICHAHESGALFDTLTGQNGAGTRERCTFLHSHWPIRRWNMRVVQFPIFSLAKETRTRDWCKSVIISLAKRRRNTRMVQFPMSSLAKTALEHKNNANFSLFAGQNGARTRLVHEVGALFNTFWPKQRQNTRAVQIPIL